MLGSFEIWNIHALKTSSFTGLAFFVWEFLITLEDEVQCMWKRSNRSMIKWLYLFSRYLGWAAHIGNQALIMLIFSQSRPADGLCRIWYLFQLAVVEGLFMNMNLILMIRVYAIYNRSHRVAILLALTFLVKMVTIIFSNARVIQALEFGPICMVFTPPHDLLYLGIGGAMMQMVIAVLTVIKYVRTRLGWGRTPLTVLFLRDGAYVFIILSTLFTAALVLIFNFSVGFLFILSSWFISTLSTAGCRLIINMHHLTLRDGNYIPTLSFEFTTGMDFLSVDEHIP